MTLCAMLLVGALFFGYQEISQQQPNAAVMSKVQATPTAFVRFATNATATRIQTITTSPTILRTSSSDPSPKPAKCNRSTATLFTSGLSYPEGLAWGKDNNLYVADNGSGRILRVNQNGKAEVFVSGLDNPNGLGFDNLGNLYVANQRSGIISRIDASANASPFFRGVEQPGGVLVDSSNNLFVGSWGSGYVIMIDQAGSANNIISDLGRVEAIASNKSGNLYFGLDVSEGRVIVHNVISRQSKVFVSGLSYVRGLAFDEDGLLYVSNAGDNSIYCFDPDGQKTQIASGLNTPGGMVVNKEVLFVAASGENAIYTIRLIRDKP